MILMVTDVWVEVLLKKMVIPLMIHLLKGPMIGFVLQPHVKMVMRIHGASVRMMMMIMTAYMMVAIASLKTTLSVEMMMEIAVKTVHLGAMTLSMMALIKMVMDGVI